MNGSSACSWPATRRRKWRGRGGVNRRGVFGGATEGALAPRGDDRRGIYGGSVALARAPGGGGAQGVARMGESLVWHRGLGGRGAPRHADGSYPAMQRRES